MSISKKITIYKLFVFNNITTFMSYCSDHRLSTKFDKKIEEEFESIKMNADTTFSFSNTDDEVMFLMKYVAIDCNVDYKETVDF